MTELVALLTVLAQLEPAVAAVVPIVQGLLAGETVSAGQMASLWAVIAQLEDRVVKAAAATGAESAQAETDVTVLASPEPSPPGPTL